MDWMDWILSGMRNFRSCFGVYDPLRNVLLLACGVEEWNASNNVTMGIDEDGNAILSEDCVST